MCYCLGDPCLPGTQGGKYLISRQSHIQTSDLLTSSQAVKDQQAILEFRRGRKRSWVGISDDRPFAYLREAMVSSLMKKICQMGDQADDNVIESLRLTISADRRASIAAAIGCWHFSAHDYTDDELVLVASLIFRHALAMPQLERWRIPTGRPSTRRTHLFVPLEY